MLTRIMRPLSPRGKTAVPSVGAHAHWDACVEGGGNLCLMHSVVLQYYNVTRAINVRNTSGYCVALY